MGGIEGLKIHKIMRKQRFQHLKALFIHFMQLCGPWITHKNDIPIHLEIVSEYDQEIPQSQTADNPVAPPGRAAQPS